MNAWEDRAMAQDPQLKALIWGYCFSVEWADSIEPRATKEKRKNDLLIWFSSVTLPYPTLCDLMDCSTPGLPVHHQLPESSQTQVHWLSDAIQPSHPLSPPSPPLNLSSIRVFSNESVLPIRWPKYWSFSFSISPSNEYSGLIYFRMDWLDLLVVQGTFKSLLQHHRSKASILRHSAFFKSNSHIHTWLLENCSFD